MDPRHPFLATAPPPAPRGGFVPHPQHQQQQHQHQQHPLHPQQRPPPPPPISTQRSRSDGERPDRPFLAGAPKRAKMSTRTPPNDPIFPPPHPHHHQRSLSYPHHPPPQNPTFPPRNYNDLPRSPELERMGDRMNPGPYRPSVQHQSIPPAQRHDPGTSNSNPSSSRGSPAAVFLPPHRTSTPDNHHRMSSVHSSPHLFRGPPQAEPMMPQSQQRPPTPSSSHPEQHPQHRGMPPPSSPHRNNSLGLPPQSQSLRPPPPPPPSAGQHQPGPPSFHQGPATTPSRDLPSLSSIHRPTMSISSMLDSPAPSASSPATSAHSLPPSMNSSRPSEFSPLKPSFTPDFPADRNRDVGSNSASPSSGTAPLPGLAGPKPNRITPPEHIYRVHHQANHLPRDREASIGRMVDGQGLSQRAMSQPVTGPPGFHPDDAMSRGPMARSESLEMQRYNYEKSIEQERVRQRDQERDRERQREEREVREREREREARIREQERELGRAREREQREEEEKRQREREQRDRDLQRERFRERDERAFRAHSQSLGHSPSNRERVENHAPQTSSSHLAYLTATSRPLSSGPQDGVQTSTAPPPASVSTPSTISLPVSSSATGGLGPTPAPLPTANTGGREGFPSFTGYTTPMPQSPFAMNASLPALPNVGDDAPEQDRRPQRFFNFPQLPGERDEPTRAEDALGIHRSISGLLDDSRRQRVRDEDGIVKDSNGIMRMQSPPKRFPPSLGGGMPAGADWNDTFPKSLLESARDKEDGGKMGLGIGMGKRDRDDEPLKIDKRKKHHHLHNHPPHHHHHHHHHVSELDASPSLDGPSITNMSSAKGPVHGHYHHAHVHVHHQHPPAGASQPSSAARISATLLIDSSKVLASLSSKPRHYLGSTVYLPTPTPKEGYSVTQPLLPRFEGRENCIFQVRIPRRFLSEQQRKDVHRRRCVWGTEVYTDDSDVLGVLIHLGKLPGVLPEGVEPSLVSDKSRKVIVNGSTSKGKKNGAISRLKENGEIVQSPVLMAGKDLVVNLLILPTLERYTGTTRNALKSRSWNTIHDGMSYSIWDMEWVEAGEAEARGMGSKKRRLDERDWVRRWGELPPSRGGMGKKGGWGKGRWEEPKGKITEVGA